MTIRGGWMMGWALAVMAVARPSLGEEPKAVETAERSPEQAAFEAGVTAFKEDRFAEALAAFMKANALRPSWKLYFNIGQCQASLKRWGDALRSFERYLAEGGDEVPDERRQTVMRDITNLRVMVGDVELIAPPGLEVYVDGVYRGVTPLAAPLRESAGVEHTIELRKGERVVDSQTFSVGSEQTGTVTVEKERAQIAAPQRPKGGDDEGGRSGAARSTVGGGVALTAIAAGLSGVMWGLTVSAKKDYESARDEYISLEEGTEFGEARAAYDSLQDKRSNVESRNRGAVVASMATGALAVATAIALIVTRPRRASRESARFTPTPNGISITF